MKKKLVIILLILLIFLPLCNSLAEKCIQMNLPEGAIARFGKGGIQMIKYSQDGSLMGVASGIGVWIYDTSTYQEVNLLTGHTELVKAFAFHPDGNIIVTGSWDGTIRVWNRITGKHKKRLIGQSIHTNTITFSPDGLLLATGSDDGNIRLWSTDKIELQKTLTGHTDWVWRVAFSPDGNILASGSADGSIR
ncbi:WD40 repeat domain-containing protein [Candidatus Poribacteria bacterium]|nr:WD40 repeat domain-containing protein [Candidatus Poribacteria bacterium]